MNKYTELLPVTKLLTTYPEWKSPVPEKSLSLYMQSGCMQVFKYKTVFKCSICIIYS